MSITYAKRRTQPIARSSCSGCGRCAINYVPRRPAMRRLLTSALAIALMTGAAATANAAMHATPAFESGATRPRTIAFLPPQAMLIKQKVVQTENQIEESGEL